jgi:hypothetical protein
MAAAVTARVDAEAPRVEAEAPRACSLLYITAAAAYVILVTVFMLATLQLLQPRFVSDGPSAVLQPSLRDSALLPSEAESLLPPVTTGGGALTLPRIAFVVNCAARHAAEWTAVLSALPNATLNDVALFFSVYGPLGAGADSAAWAARPARYGALGAPLAPLFGGHEGRLAPQLVHAARDDPANTWTTGRNALFRIVYAAERTRGLQFSYWVAADGDAAHLDCEPCARTRPPDYSGPACCLDMLLRALPRDGFSHVGTTFAKEEIAATAAAGHAVGERTFAVRDCTDAQIEAFHRDAVPLLLPYHEEFENVTWIASQSMLFLYTSTCLRGSGAVGLGAVVWDNEHAQGYARVDHAAQNAVMRAAGGRMWADEAAFASDFARQCDAPPNTPGSVTQAETVMEVEAAADPSRATTATGIAVAPRVRWNETCAFAACSAAFEARFVTRIGGGAPQAPRPPATLVGRVWGWQAVPGARAPWTAEVPLMASDARCDAVTGKELTGGLGASVVMLP